MHVFLLVTPVTCYLDTPVTYSCYRYIDIHVIYSCHTLLRYLTPEKCFLCFYHLSLLYEESCELTRPCTQPSYFSMYQLGMGRLYDWLDLIGWVFWIYLSPTAVDMVVLATVRYSSLRFLFHVPLLAEGPGLSMPEVHLGSWSLVYTGYTYLIRAHWSLGHMALVLHSRLA